MGSPVITPPPGYQVNPISSIRKAAYAAPVDTSDVIDRTQPQTLSQRVAEKVFDAKNYVGQLVGEAKKELNPPAAPSGNLSGDASSQAINTPPPVAPSKAMDAALLAARFRSPEAGSGAVTVTPPSGYRLNQ